MGFNWIIDQISQIEITDWSYALPQQNQQNQETVRDNNGYNLPVDVMQMEDVEGEDETQFPIGEEYQENVS